MFSVVEGVAELVIEQVCYFPDSRRFLFTWMCVRVCDLEIQTKRAYIRVTCVHIYTAVHTDTVLRWWWWWWGLLKCMFVLCKTPQRKF